MLTMQKVGVSHHEKEMNQMDDKSNVRAEIGTGDCDWRSVNIGDDGGWWREDR